MTLVTHDEEALACSAPSLKFHMFEPRSRPAQTRLSWVSAALLGCLAAGCEAEPPCCLCHFSDADPNHGPCDSDVYIEGDPDDEPDSDMFPYCDELCAANIPSIDGCTDIKAGGESCGD
jgi:hypothetical protein